MRRATISLSDEFHEELRREASRSRLSIAEVIRRRLQVPAKEPVNGPRREFIKRYAGSDPLLKVAGICGGPMISANIDDELSR